MFTGHDLARCVVIGGILFFPSLQAIAQRYDDPFGEVGDPAVADGAANPAAVAAEEPANEKSVLAAETPKVERGKNQDFCRCVGEGDSAAVARIEKVLRSPLGSNGIEFIDAPLEDVVNALQDEYGIPIQMDETALEAIGLDPTEKVTANLHNISLGSALRLILKRLQLASVIHDEVLIITTPEEAEARLSTCVYNARDFVVDTSDKSMDALIDTIVSCVSTETWAENGGGEAEVRSLKPGLLVISQTQAVHGEINSLLKAIRDMRERGGGANNHDAAMPGAGAEEVVTRLYVMQINGNTEKLGDKVREMIIQSIPDVQWDGQLPDGQSVMLSVLGDRVIVRHTPSVQDKVTEFLQDSSVATPARPSDLRRGQGAPGPRDADGNGAGGGGLSGGGQDSGGGGYFSPVSHPPRIDE